MSTLRLLTNSLHLSRTYRMVKVGVGVGLRTGPKQSFALPAPHVRDVLDQVGHALIYT